MQGRLAGAARKVVVLGGGISGLGAAWRLGGRGVPVEVLEAAPEVGGLAGTHREDGYFLDVGPHSLFSEDGEILRTLLGLFDPPPPGRHRRVKLLHENRFIDYPLTAHGVLLQMGPLAGARAALSLLRGRLLPRPPRPGDAEQTVEDWAIGHFGEYLHRTFFRPYTEQFWRMPCGELSAEAIPSHTRMSFASTLRHLLVRRRARPGASLIDREALPTHYPEGGFSGFASRIADAVAAQGGRVRTGCEATDVEPLPDGTVRVGFRRGATREEVVADHVISTVPLPLLAGMLRPAPPPEVRAAAAALEYRSLVVLGVVTRRPKTIDSDYLYLLNRPYNRLFQMNAFSPLSSPAGENILAVELPCRAGDPVWEAPAAELLATCIGPLARDGILRPAEVERLIVVRARHAYPVYRTGWRTHLDRVLGHLAALGCVTPLGRCGEFRYMDIDRCLRRAFTVADGLLAGRPA